MTEIKPAEPTPEQVLELVIDVQSMSLRDFLIDLLSTLWREGSDFSGKRPFGDSGWQFDVYGPMVARGWIAGELDEDGYVDNVDVMAADRLVAAAIETLRAKPAAPAGGAQ